MFELVSEQDCASATKYASYFSTTKADNLSISFPEQGKHRARKVVTRSQARRTGKYPSWKMGRMIQWESCNEKTVFRALDGDAAVIAFYEQPCRVHYLDDDVVRDHYPDVLVEFVDGVEVWEIKDANDPLDSELLRRTRILEHQFAQLGVQYRLIPVDKESAKGVDSYSASLVRFGRSPISNIERERARRFFERTRRISWQDAESGCLGERSKNIVARLLLEGELTASERSAPISSKTEIVATSEIQSLVSNWRC